MTHEAILIFVLVFIGVMVALIRMGVRRWSNRRMQGKLQQWIGEEKEDLLKSLEGDEDARNRVVGTYLTGLPDLWKALGMSRAERKSFWDIWAKMTPEQRWEIAVESLYDRTPPKKLLSDTWGLTGYRPHVTELEDRLDPNRESYIRETEELVRGAVNEGADSGYLGAWQSLSPDDQWELTRALWIKSRVEAPGDEGDEAPGRATE